MDPCPEVAASWVSQLFFCWLSPLFCKGKERPLAEEDIPPLNPVMESRRLTEDLEYYWQEQLRTGQPSLLKAILKQHANEILLFSFCFLIEGVLATTATYLSTRVVSYFDLESSTTRSDAFLMTGCCMAINLYLVITSSYFYYRWTRIGACMRIAVTGLVYQKACLLSQAEIADKSIGHIITLITNDAQRLDEDANNVGPFLGTPIVMSLAYFMLANEIGYTLAAIAFATMMLALPLQMLLGKIIAWLRVKTAPVTDERVKLINEVFTSMKVIKMYGWEIMFKEMIEKVRAKEMFYIGLYLVSRGLTIACILVWCPVLTPMVTFAYMLSCGQALTMTNTFTLLSMVLIVGKYFTVELGYSCMVIAQFYQTTKRIQTFLFYDEVNHLCSREEVKRPRSYGTCCPTQGDRSLSNHSPQASEWNNPLLESSMKLTLFQGIKKSCKTIMGHPSKDSIIHNPSTEMQFRHDDEQISSGTGTPVFF